MNPVNVEQINVVKDCLKNWISRLENKIIDLENKIEQIKNQSEHIFDDENLKKIKYDLHSVS